MVGWTPKLVTALLNNLPKVVKALEVIAAYSLAAEFKYEVISHGLMGHGWILNVSSP